MHASSVMQIYDPVQIVTPKKTETPEFYKYSVKTRTKITFFVQSVLSVSGLYCADTKLLITIKLR